jgi:hypothetical protein
LSFTPLLGVSFFAFLNPKIINDVWGITVFAMGVAGAVTYALTRPPTPRPAWPGIVAFILGMASLGGLLSLAGDVLTLGSAALGALLARVFFIAFFVGCSGAIGWVMARVLP